MRITTTPQELIWPRTTTNLCAKSTKNNRFAEPEQKHPSPAPASQYAPNPKPTPPIPSNTSNNSYGRLSPHPAPPAAQGRHYSNNAPSNYGHTMSPPPTGGPRPPVQQNRPPPVSRPPPSPAPPETGGDPTLLPLFRAVDKNSAWLCPFPPQGR